MDPCPFVRLIVESLAVDLPAAARPYAGAGVHPSTTPCYAKLKLPGFPSQTALLLLSSASDPPESSPSVTAFHLDPVALRRFSSKPVVALKVSVFTGRMGRACGITAGKLLGSVQVPVCLGGAQFAARVYHAEWMKLDGGSGGELPAKLHLTVRSEPDPRFVFHFGGEPECSPVVFQIQGSIRQPVFSCKFSADRCNRTRSLPSDFNATGGRTWFTSGDRERAGRERKGWMIIIYDLSGSAVAAASMATPFVPSPGSDRVSRSNPGAWLILCPSGGGWKPWGRLEAWRERGSVDSLGYKFELITDAGLATAVGIPITQGTMSMKKGGKFCIDRKDLGAAAGFVMASTVEGEGKASKPAVEVGARHVTCMADAALFVALAAAVDLTMDACRLFSHKLRKEFSCDAQELFL